MPLNLENVDWSLVQAVLSAEGNSLAEFAKCGDLDPTKCFRFAKLAGVSLSDIDIRNVDFRGADLRETNVRHSIFNYTTIFVDALLDQDDSDALASLGYVVPRPRPHEREIGYFHLHLVSAGTGETLITVARAAAAQYTKLMQVEHMHPLVRVQKQLDRALAEIEASPGIVLYMLLQENLAAKLEEKCGALGLPCLSTLGPVLQLFQAYLGAVSMHKVGRLHTLNAEYFRRIDALNYTMQHDNGQWTDDLEEADVVLVGVLRTSKTPTSIFLANRGVKVANFDLVNDDPALGHIASLKSPLVIGLFAQSDEIVAIREIIATEQRNLLPAGPHTDPASLPREIIYSKKKFAKYVRAEIILSKKLFATYNWPSINVTGLAVEEIAAAALNLLNNRRSALRR